MNVSAIPNGTKENFAYKLLQRLVSAQLTLALVCGFLAAYASGKSSGSSWQVSLFGEIGDRDLLKVIILCAVLILVYYLETSKLEKFLHHKSFLNLSYRVGKLNAILFGFIVFTPPIFGPFLLGTLFGDSARINAYKVFNVGALEEPFADLSTTLFAISCPEVNSIGDYISCGDRGNVWLYPSALLKLRRLGIDASMTELFGVLFLFFVLVSLVWTFLNLSRFPQCLLAIVVISPGFQLMLGGGNLDLLVFVCVSTALRIGVKTRAHFLIFMLAILIGSLFKFYLITSLCVVALFYLSKIKTNFFEFFFCLASLLSALLLVPEAWQSRFFGVKDLSGSFGFPNLLSLISSKKTATFESFWLAWPILLIILII